MWNVADALLFNKKEQRRIFNLRGSEKQEYHTTREEKKKKTTTTLPQIKAKINDVYK